MSSADRYQQLARPAASAAIVLSLGAVCLLVYFCLMQPALSTAAAYVPDTGTQSAWPSGVRQDETGWTIFRSLGSSSGVSIAAVAGGPLAQRFRLAGIFVWTTENGEMVRKAILDNLQTRQENIGAEGDVVDGAQIVRVLEKSIILREGGREEELALSYLRLADGAVQVTTAKPIAVPTAAPEADRIISTNQFGAQVGETRWVMNREGLISYIQELSDNPARMEKLFDSMVPAWDTGPDGRRTIGGYRLHMVGEQDFYKAVGLQEGDVVKKVNDTQLASQRQCMWWIDQFRQNKQNAFVLDVDRGGTATRLEYMVKTP